MPTLRERIVAEAREWIGTPYMHQARLKGIGVDCVGLPIGVCRALGLDVPRAEALDGYGNGIAPDGASVVAASDKILDRIPVSATRPGDLLLLRWQRGEDLQHFAIVADYKYGGLSIIHALGQINGRGNVAEHRLTPEMKSRISAAFLMPGVGG